MATAATAATTTRRSGGGGGGGGEGRAGWRRWAALLLALLILCAEFDRHQVDARSLQTRYLSRRSVRLCSRSLSDALHLLCNERGYNEPFSSSGETEVRHTGPGLVEECCYNACSMEQMEQYCKPKLPTS